MNKINITKKISINIFSIVILIGMFIPEGYSLFLLFGSIIEKKLSMHT